MRVVVALALFVVRGVLVSVVLFVWLVLFVVGCRVLFGGVRCWLCSWFVVVDRMLLCVVGCCCLLLFVELLYCIVFVA